MTAPDIAPRMAAPDDPRCSGKDCALYESGECDHFPGTACVPSLRLLLSDSRAEAERLRQERDSAYESCNTARIETARVELERDAAVESDKAARKRAHRAEQTVGIERDGFLTRIAELVDRAMAAEMELDAARDCINRNTQRIVDAGIGCKPNDESYLLTAAVTLVLHELDAAHARAQVAIEMVGIQTVRADRFRRVLGEIDARWSCYDELDRFMRDVRDDLYDNPAPERTARNDKEL